MNCPVPNKSTILSDHKKIGKEFVPPLLALPLQFNRLSWVDCIMPELIWLALLQDKLGIKRAVEICESIAEKTFQLCKTESSSPVFAFTSNFKKLSQDDFKRLIDHLDSNKYLVDVSYALSDLIILYPKCPLHPLHAIRDTNYDIKDNLINFKKILTKYFDKCNQQSTLLQTTALYMAIIAKKITISKSIPFHDLNILITSPNSNEAKKTAAFVRSSVMSLMAIEMDTYRLMLTKEVELKEESTQEKCNDDWATYFWNRGLMLDECT